MSSLRTSFHVFAIAALTYPYFWIWQNPNKISSSYGGQFQMFTIVTLSITYLQFYISVVQDYFPNIKTIRTFKGLLLVVTGPCETLVSTLYWTIKYIDPSLLAEKELLDLFPLSADLSMHAVPTLLLLVEMFCFSEAVETSDAQAAGIYALYASTYYFWTERNAALNGWYPYPMLDLMSKEQRIGTFAGATGIAFLSFLLLKRVYVSIHGTPNKLHKTRREIEK